MSKVISEMKTNLFVLAFLTLVTLLFISPRIFAGDYLIGNYDIKGSRAIPSSSEPSLTRAKVIKEGLEVKWHTEMDGWVVTPPIVSKNIVFVGTNLYLSPFVPGSIYALNANSGKVNWHAPIAGGVVSSPLVVDNMLYVFGFDGTMYKFNKKSGALLASHRVGLHPNPAIDSAWAGVIFVPNQMVNGVKKDLIVSGINPNDEQVDANGNPIPDIGIGAVVAFDADTLDVVWTTKTTLAGEGGAGIWESSPSYSSKLNLIYVTTGQTTKFDPNKPQPTPLEVGSDSVFAIDASDGHVVWRTPLRPGSTDLWNFSIPFNPADPTDTDVADGAALFELNGKEYVAMGSKRGYFYVLDAETGAVVNSSGIDSLGFVKGLDAYIANTSDPNILAVGNGIDGGYNLDSGYFEKNGNIIHFGTIADYSDSMETVATDTNLYPDSNCVIGGFGVPGVPCPLLDFGRLILISGDGDHEIGRYSVASNHLFTPTYLDDMIIMRASPNEPTIPGATVPDSIIVLDVSDPSSPKLIQQIPLVFGNVVANSGGSTITIGNGMIYTGNGFFGFGPQQGLFAIGLIQNQQ